MTNAMKTLADIPHLSGVKVLLRVDFNVPIKNGAIGDDFRIRKALPTIDFLRNKGARLIIVSHIETAEGLVEAGSSKPGVGTKNPLEKRPTLAPVADYLKKKGLPMTFVKNLASAFEAAENLKDGEMILLENIRENPGEKENDKKFAKQLTSLGDIYVNDAFSVSHREHASICAVTEFLPSYAGLQFEEEVKQLSAAFSPSHPFVFILGGAKFDTKLPLIQKFSKTADTVFIGGALANDALKVKGYEIGASKVSDGTDDISSVVNQPNIMIPSDVIVQDHALKDINAVSPGDTIFDSGQKTIAALKEKINAAQFILWNGPLGLFEKGFTEATEELAKIIALKTSSDKNVHSIIGGGDTLSAISKLGVEDKFTFVSTGGGAMLDFLATGTLPGIEALDRSEA
jgi:phosphoglycerate kinase